MRQFRCWQRWRRTKGRGSGNFPTPPRRLDRATVVHIGISRSFFYSVHKGTLQYITVRYKTVQWQNGMFQSGKLHNGTFKTVRYTMVNYGTK